MKFLALGIFIVILIIYTISNLKTKESFISTNLCPEKLVYNNGNITLWKNDKVEKVFKNYSEYLKYYHFSKKSYDKKGFVCNPLIVEKNNIEDKGTLVDTSRVFPKLFNLEGFQNNSRGDLKNIEKLNVTWNKVINKNMGKPLKNPQGKRNLNPDNAPYTKYIENVGKKLQDISIKIEKKSNKKENFLNKNKKIISKKNSIVEKMKNKNEKYLKKDLKLRNRIIKENLKKEKFQSSNQNSESGDKNLSGSNQNDSSIKNPSDNKKTDNIKRNTSPEEIKEDSNDNMKMDTKQDYYSDATNNETQLLRENKRVIKNINHNFAYKPEVKFDHKQPSKKTASAYGWSYIPPQYWSVPQKRPPVCLPDTNGTATVASIYDKGTPVDALDFTKVGSILPKFEFKEVHNPNYYYPGWIAQDKIEYPIGKGKKFNGKKEFYNYNIAEKTG